LQRRSVLEFIDQCDRVLRQNARAQHLAFGQRRIEPCQHVGKTETCRLALELGHAGCNARASMEKQRGLDLRQGRERSLERGKVGKNGRQFGHAGRIFGGIKHAFGRETVPASFQIRRLGIRILAPAP